MSQWQLQTAVAFLIFNRPDTTAQVFARIREAAPPRLLVVADGPRADRAGEAERCAAAREVVAAVDWPCEVFTNFSDVNLGCRKRVQTGLDWVFSVVEEAIILEDDCLPHPTFFRFCEELLERYRDDSRVMMISGDNFGAGSGAASYYFSRYPHIWGWASWRRSWARYDGAMASWPAAREQGWLARHLGSKQLAHFWREAFDAVHSGTLDTWDHQLAFSCMINDALCVMPRVNLVSNIGFGADATHTRVRCRLSELPLHAMQFPLRHPAELVRDARADARTEKEQHAPLTFFRKVKIALSQVFPAAAGGHAGHGDGGAR